MVEMGVKVEPEIGILCRFKGFKKSPPSDDIYKHVFKGKVYNKIRNIILFPVYQPHTMAYKKG